MCCGNCKSAEESKLHAMAKLTGIVINQFINYVDSMQTLLDRIEEDEEMIEVAKTLTDNAGICAHTYQRTSEEIL